MGARRGGGVAAALLLAGAFAVATAGQLLSALPDQLDVEYAAGVSTCASEGGDDTTCDADVLSPGEDSVVVSWAVAADATGATPVKATVALCYSVFSQTERPWRKSVDNLGKNKQCIDKASGLDFATGTVTIPISDVTVKATYFARVYGEAEDGTLLSYGNTKTFIKVGQYNGVTDSLVAWASALSALSVLLLAARAVYGKYIAAPEPTAELVLLKAEDFDLPVDSEHKATELRIMSTAMPHMRAFHFAWIMFFTAFLSTFAPAALSPIIRQDLDLTKSDLGDAGTAAVAGTIFCRLVMGTVCDTFGPRYGFSILMVLTAPAVYCMALAENAVGFILCRFFIGFSLATFVSCQFWCSVMFNGKIVGLANATAGGWGNLGGGVTQFLIPAIFSGIAKSGVPDFTAWRWTFFVPATAHVVLGLGCLFFAQDMPDGQYAFLKKTGQMEAVSAWKVLRLGISNYRMWVLASCYGFCYGIELTMNNIVVDYFYDQFDMDIVTAGICGSLFGMMNLVARSVGGQLSDAASTRFGMRGRLWVLWAMQTGNGIMCIVCGRSYNSLVLTIIAMILFSSLVQAAEGATYGIVPFVSRRALGVVSGFVGAGGNVGAVLMMNAFFTGSKSWADDIPTYDGITYMGIVVCVVTPLVCTLHFPMWGSMFFKASEAATEEEYYLKDYSAEEVASGVAKSAQMFSVNARGERGRDR